MTSDGLQDQETRVTAPSREARPTGRAWACWDALASGVSRWVVVAAVWMSMTAASLSRK